MQTVKQPLGLPLILSSVYSILPIRSNLIGKKNEGEGTNQTFAKKRELVVFVTR